MSGIEQGVYGNPEVLFQNFFWFKMVK